MWIIAVIILTIVLFFLLRKPGRGKFRMGSIEFYSKGLDAGFSLQEIHILWQASRLARLSHPVLLYGSTDELDSVISCIVGDRKFSDWDEDESESKLLKKLFDYRNKIEWNHPRFNSGLFTTRDIAEGQRIKIRVEGIGTYQSRIVFNETEYLTIAIPTGNPLPPKFSWRKILLNVYFWRKGDARYFFQSRLLEHYRDRESKYYRMHHSEVMLRSQKRQSIRASCPVQAQFYPLKTPGSSDFHLETNPGLNCLVLDLSEDGISFKMGGKGRRGLAFKLQFEIRGETVAVIGVVKHVRYVPEKNQSTFHGEFVPLPQWIRLLLLAFVYNIDHTRSEHEFEDSTDGDGDIQEQAEKTLESPESVAEDDAEFPEDLEEDETIELLEEVEDENGTEALSDETQVLEQDQEIKSL